MSHSSRFESSSLVVTIIWKHQTSINLFAFAEMSASTSHRRGFGTSFDRRPAATKGDRTVTAVSLSAPGPRQDRPGSFGEQQERSGFLELPSRAPSLHSNLPASIESSPATTATTTSPGPVNEQQLLSQQISQLSGSLATCVHQNELVISLLERLVTLTEATASRSNAASDSTAVTSPRAPPRAQNVSGSGGSATISAPLRADPSCDLQHMMSKAMTTQQESSKLVDSDASLNTLYNASFHFDTSTGAAIVVQGASKTESMLSSPPFQAAASMPVTGSSSNVIAPGPTPLRCGTVGLLTNEQANHALLMSYASFNSSPASLLINEVGQHRISSRRSSSATSTLPQSDGSNIPSVNSIDSIRLLSDDGQPQRKRKRIDRDGATCSDTADHPEVSVSVSEDKESVGSWQDWLAPRQLPLSVLENLPRAKHRTLREVRAEIKASSSRPSGAVGRIPLKQYLEVSGPEECRAVRRLGRKLYVAWLEPNTRLGKQDTDRLSACINRIEHAFPVLADCEEHWKARQVMLQIIDNAIDEHKSSERRNTAISKTGASDMPSRRRGRPKGTTAAAMAQRRQGQKLAYASQEEDEGNETDADGSSDSSDSETDA